jgi:adenylate cyclase
LSDLTNYRRDLAVLETRLPQIQHIPPTGGPTPPIAPWMSPNGFSTPSSTMPTSFYNDSSDNLSLASQLSPGYPSTNARAGANHGAQDSPDAAYYNDDRRPSAASILTASSTGSKTSLTRGGFRKLQGFFGEEFPGRDSSESSLPTSFMGKDQRQRSYSHSRPTQRDRNYSNATDHTRDVSPSSSRPRTPVPDPEVVPFLFQEPNVRLLCAALLHSYRYPQTRSRRYPHPSTELALPLLLKSCASSCRARNATLTLCF